MSALDSKLQELKHKLELRRTASRLISAEIAEISEEIYSFRNKNVEKLFIGNFFTNSNTIKTTYYYCKKIRTEPDIQAYENRGEDVGGEDVGGEDVGGEDVEGVDMFLICDTFTLTNSSENYIQSTFFKDLRTTQANLKKQITREEYEQGLEMLQNKFKEFINIPRMVLIEKIN